MDATGQRVVFDSAGVTRHDICARHAFGFTRDVEALRAPTVTRWVAGWTTPSSWTTYRLSPATACADEQFVKHKILDIWAASPHPAESRCTAEYESAFARAATSTSRLLRAPTAQPEGRRNW